MERKDAAPMPLTSHPRAAQMFDTYVGFTMRNGDQQVIVHVTVEALQKLDPQNWVSPLAQYDAYCSRLWEIASIKFDRAEIDARSGVIKINEEDLMLSGADC